MNIIEQAFILAMSIHANQRRKASIIPGGTPYMSHLMEAAGMVYACGGTDETVAAALLHDAIEDQGIEHKAAIAAISPEILALVEACTEQGTGSGVKPPWRERKEAYLAHIADLPLPALLIVAADKLQSARELRRKCRLDGRDDTLAKFGGGVEGQRWFQHALCDALGLRLIVSQADLPMTVGARALIGELTSVVYDIFPWGE
jgi:(p)ppGpp synthase/HD superfamily hydrolase